MNVCACVSVAKGSKNDFVCLLWGRVMRFSKYTDYLCCPTCRRSCRGGGASGSILPDTSTEFLMTHSTIHSPLYFSIKKRESLKRDFLINWNSTGLCKLPQERRIRLRAESLGVRAFARRRGAIWANDDSIPCLSTRAPCLYHPQRCT